MSTKDTATLSVLLAFISMVLQEYLGHIFAATLGIAGLIFGLVALKKIKNTEDKTGKYKTVFAIFVGLAWILIEISILLSVVQTP